MKFAHGNIGEIIVVMQKEFWDFESGSVIQNVFAQEIQTLPMEEPLFSLFQINKSEFDAANLLHKNIIFQDINPEIKKSNIKIIHNKYAKNQIFVHVTVKDQHDFVKIISEHKNTLINLFLNADRKRLVSNYKKYNNRNSRAVLRSNFDIDLMVPQKFKVDVNKKDFVWLSNETQTYTQNILVFSYPLTDSTKLEKDFLIAKTNEILKNNVPGENKNSFMSLEIEYDYPQFYKTTTLKLETGVLNGLWKVKGDFMGGPFVSYTKIDERRNLVVTVFGFVYNPNARTRNLIRELDATFNTFDFIF